jgi:hypothetical protein
MSSADRSAPRSWREWRSRARLSKPRGSASEPHAQVDQNHKRAGPGAHTETAIAPTGALGTRSRRQGLPFRAKRVLRRPVRDARSIGKRVSDDGRSALPPLLKTSTADLQCRIAGPNQQSAARPSGDLRMSDRPRRILLCARALLRTRRAAFTAPGSSKPARSVGGGAVRSAHRSRAFRPRVRSPARSSWCLTCPLVVSTLSSRLAGSPWNSGTPDVSVGGMRARWSGAQQHAALRLVSHLGEQVRRDLCGRLLGLNCCQLLEDFGAQRPREHGERPAGQVDGSPPPPRLSSPARSSPPDGSAERGRARS